MPNVIINPQNWQKADHYFNPPTFVLVIFIRSRNCILLQSISPYSNQFVSTDIYRRIFLSSKLKENYQQYDNIFQDLTYFHSTIID